MPIERMKPLQFYVPIERVDDEERIVEGYAFVNEVVPGEGGLRLKRSAMEAATPDYLRWGAVREMHQAVAAGTTLGVHWDERGALIRAKVVDDAAWKKVQERVYKGFSVGVAPRMMRGKDVEACTWIETSLVDRPKDPDAVLAMFRADGIDADVEVEVLPADREDPVADPEPAVERAEEAAVVEVEVEVEVTATETPTPTPTPTSFDAVLDGYLSAERADDLATAIDALWVALYDIVSYGAEDLSVEERGRRIRESIEQFADYLVPRMTERRGEMEAALERLRQPSASETAPEVPDVQRFAALETERSELLQRVTALETDLTTARSELATVRADLQAAEERAEALKREPVGTPPVRFPQALDRQFLTNQGTPPQQPVQTLRDEMKRLQDEAQQERDTGKQQALIARINLCKQGLRALGESV